MDPAQSVRALFDAFARRDLEAALAAVDPELRFWPQGTLELSGRRVPYEGRDGLRRYFADAARGWAALELDPRDVRVAGDGVIVFGVVHGTTAAGEAVHRQAIWVFKLRGGLVLSCRAVATAEEAATRAAGTG